MSKVTSQPPSDMLSGVSRGDTSPSVPPRNAEMRFHALRSNDPGTTRAQAREALRASFKQPGLAGTPEAVEKGVRHAKIEAAVASLVEPDPQPGTMAFNEAHKRHLARHNKGPHSAEVQKARMLATIAEGQANAGVRFKGQLTPLEARLSRADLENVQTSQAARTQSPVAYAMQVVQDSMEWMGTQIFGQRSPTAPRSGNVHRLPISVVEGVLKNTFEVVKSQALVELEKQGGSAHNIAFVVMDTDHASTDDMAAFLNLLAGAFRAEMGDLVLYESVDFDGSGLQVMAQKADCEHRGVSFEPCEFLAEPPETAAISSREVTILKAWNLLRDDLLEVLPAKEAAAVRADFQRERDKLVRSTELSIKTVSALVPEHFRRYTNPHEHAELRARCNTLTGIHNTWVTDFLAVSAVRTIAYWSEIGQRLKQGSGNIFGFMGAGHGPAWALEHGHAKPADFNGDVIPAFYLTLRKPKAKARDQL